MGFFFNGNYLYDIGSVLVIDNKTYIVRKVKDGFTSQVRCKYCPFKKTSCHRGLCEALNIQQRLCQNIVTLNGRLEPLSSIQSWKYIFRRNKYAKTKIVK